MDGREVRRRALTGAMFVGARGTAVRIIALGANVALARLLTPAEFGTAAIGLSFVMFATLLSDGGIGALLIRRKEPPTEGDLRALLGVQYVGTVTFGAAVAAVALQFGHVGEVIAVMMAALPWLALRGPGLILLQRDLRFGPVAAAEVAEVLAYSAWAVATVALGAGVWGLATAAIVRGIVGGGLIFALSPRRFLRPTLSWTHIRPLLSFGLRFQAVSLAHAGRDQGVTLGTGIISGTATAGLWTIAYRVLQLPFLLFESLWRVSYPAMSRLLSLGENPRNVIERGVEATCLGTGLVLAGLVGSSPALIPAVFGARWEPAADVIPLASIGLAFGGPISVATAGYLYASGEVRTVLRSSLLEIVAWFGITFPLLPVIGVAATGIGWTASAAVQSFIFTRATRRRTGARFARLLAVPLAVTAVAAGASWAMTEQMPDTLLSAAAGGAAGSALFLVGILLLRRRAFLDTLALIARVARRDGGGAAEPVG